MADDILPEDDDIGTKKRADRDLLLILRIKLDNIEHLFDEVKRQQEKDLDSVKKTIEKIEADFQKELDAFKKTIQDLEESNKKTYVLKESFDPVKSITYGIIGTIGLAIIGAMFKFLGL